MVQAPPTLTTWSGQTFKPDALFPDAGGAYKVCRYFRDGKVVVHDNFPDDPGDVAFGDYEEVAVPVVNQNFLVIRAAYNCPDPPTVSTPHQDASYPPPEPGRGLDWRA